jgi:Carboxypeptidase regulatory-like domain
MQRLLNIGFSLVILLGLCGVMQPAWGQEVSAVITGSLVDPTGAPISKATVTARDTDRGTVYTTQTNDSGIFNFSRIPIGHYEVRATASGFETAVQPPFTLVLNQTARLEFKMKVGAASENIEVTSEIPQLQTDTTQVSTLIDSTAVNNIPLATRNYIELTLLSPGSISPDPANFNNGNNTAAGARPYINGNREQANNFLLDGLDNNQVSDNLVGFTPAPDAIQEFNLITSDAPAEFGRYMGGIVNATIKSGTNQFHGDVWEYFRNDVLNANFWENGFRGPDNQIPKQKVRWNMFGGAVGGPIIKNKLFFFVDYQGQRFDYPATTQAITVFTSAQRNGDFSGLCTTGFNNGLCNNPSQQIVNPLTKAPFPNNQIPMNLENVVAKNLFASNFYPSPVNNSPTNNAFNTQTQIFDNNQGDAKVDWNISDKDALFGRYSQSYQNNPQINSVAILGNPSSTAPIQSGVGQWTHTFSPNLLNEARFGINYIKLNTGVAFSSSLGDLGTQLGIANANTVGPGLLLLGFNGGTAPAPGMSAGGSLTNVGNAVVAQTFHDTVTQFDDGVVIIHGKHVIRTGFQMWRYHINTFYSGNSGEFGSILFGGAFSGNAASDFFLGYAAATGKGISGTGGWHQSSWTFAGYVQDNWRLTPNLTLNLGLRYEANTPWVEQNNRQANLGLFSGQVLLAGQNGNSRSLYNSVYGLPDWQPRIGFAWSPASYDGKLVVRGAYSISSYLEGTGTNLRLPQNVPFQPPEVDAQYNSPTYMTQEGPGGSLPGNPFVGANFRVWAPTVQPAVDQQWNITIQQELANNLTLQMGYVGQKAQHLMVPMPYLQDQIVNGQVVPGVYFSGNPTLVSELGQVSGTASVGYMNYNALQVVLQKRYSNGLQGQLAYTWSHCLTNNSGYYGTWGTQTQATPGSPYYQNLYDPQADYASCYMDSRNILSAYATYDLPFGKGKKYGSNMNSVANAIVGNWQANAIISIHSGFPLAVYEATDTSGTNSRGPRPNCTGLTQSFGTSKPVIVNGVFQGYQYINVAGYSEPATGTFGNCPLQGPNVGPGYTDTDLSLLKNFHFTERMYLQFRTDFLNAFNNVQLSHPNVNFPSSTFGLINTSMDTPRNIQFALKFYF